MTKPRLGVVLFQLGGPDSPAAVEPFLYNLFCDPDIIDFPGAWLARRPLAWWIAHRRAAIVGEHYEAIGGHSPIRRLTELQARRLEQALAPDFDARCFLAMRYWHPLTLEAVEAVRSAHRDAPLDMLVLLPLYPQYSFATTRSSLKEWRRVSAQSRVPSPSPREIVIEEFHLHPQYIGALVRNIETALARFADRSKVHLVFSAHGLPLSLIARGDPYQRQVQETVAAVMARGGWPHAHTLCFQSRVGRQKWLEPALTYTLERLPREGNRHLLVIPISFVTEHIETLHEINIEARAQALAAGVQQFEVMPALDDSPEFIAALAALVRAAAAAPASAASASSKPAAPNPAPTR
ncbi:MAG: ferrochelatase [Acidobacteria bacterium]|nr:MAG: ferrochelatase [Acidobacteriota bacterium]